MSITPRDLLHVISLAALLVLAATAPPAPALGPRLPDAPRALVDLNRAPLAELEALDGVGPALARRIVAARPFATIGDVARVRGIGPKRLARLREQGLAVLDE
jgi:competence protein ComEA